MGLGPPVCQHCKVMGELSDEKGWHCPICGELDLHDHAGFNIEHWKQLRRNEKFLRFVKGEDYETSD